MIKHGLMKVLVLGLCMSAFTGGVAFAQSTEASSPAYYGEDLSDELKALIQKQAEMDRKIFGEYAEELEAQEIYVNYTGITDTYVEIGISPYSDEKADYLYQLFGKDIQVVEADQSMLYATTGIAEPVASDIVEDTDIETAPDIEAYDTTASDPIAPDTPVDSGAGLDTPEENKVYKDGDVKIQIESIPEDLVEDVPESDEDQIYYTTADTVEDGKEVQLVSAADDSAVAESRVSKDKDGVSAPLVILAIAGGAAAIGGAVIATNKKKTAK